MNKRKKERKEKELKTSDVVFYSMLFLVFCTMLSVVQNTLYLTSDGTLLDDCIIFLLSLALTIMLVILPYYIGIGKINMLLPLALIVSVISSFVAINNVLSMNIVEDEKINKILIIISIHILPPIISYVCGKSGKNENTDKGEKKND